MADVTDLSLHAQALRAAGERVVSTDERTGIQALERTRPPIPMGPGRAERREFADIRRGTLTLIAHVDVAQGTIVMPSRGPIRTAEDFVAHMTRTVASEPQATRWHVVADHLNLHQSESLGRFVAEHDGITDNLGKKEQHGMLQSMATRAALLSDPTPRLVFHSTPKQASWMNQMERWCSIVVRQLLKRASCTSVED
jgi:putative transposase